MSRYLLRSLCAATLLAFGANANANLINEFEPNPAGGDPADTTFELSGTPSTAFDLWIVSIENDGLNGTVDRAAQVTGSYDASGLAVVTVPDLENPTFTVILTDDFGGAIGDDIDPADDGTLDLSEFGTILDAVGVSDSFGDDATLYAAGLGGTNILYNGQFEPLLAYRDGATGEFLQTVTVNFGDPDQFVGVFTAGGELIPGAFSFDDPGADVTATTFGAVNPSNVIPEPGTMVLVLLGSAAGVAVRMRRTLG
ncbi:MAG: PEP-CTERM sorting domain-containing protein [Planctomycetota bacterium]